MSIKDYDIPSITNGILDGMVEERLYCWDDFCSQFLGMSVPLKGTKAYIYYVRIRVAVKNNINAELVKKKQGCRLVVSPNSGVTLMGNVKAPIDTVAKTIKKRLSLQTRSKNRLESFLNSPEITDTYKKHLRNIIEISDGNYKTFIGHVVCSDKLPGYIKTEIIKTLPKDTQTLLLGETA